MKQKIKIKKLSLYKQMQKMFIEDHILKAIALEKYKLLIFANPKISINPITNSVECIYEPDTQSLIDELDKQRQYRLDGISYVFDKEFRNLDKPIEHKE